MESVRELEEIIQKYSFFKDDLIISEFLDELKMIKNNINYQMQE